MLLRILKLREKSKNTLLLIYMLIATQVQVFSQDINEFIEYGRHAPSSHNAQMWKIDTTQNSIRITLDSTKLLNEVDPLNREAWISLGAFAENCILSAFDLEYDCDIQINKGVDLVFSKNLNHDKSSYTDLIMKRRTTRNPFKKKELQVEHQSIIENFDLDNILYYPLSTDKGKILAKNIYESNVAQLNDSAKLKELSDWTITSKKEEKKRDDGLTPSALGINGISRFFYYMLFNKEKLQSDRFIKLAQKSALKQVNSCSGYIIITSNQNDKENWINSGQLLQRLWLKLTELNISVHPMSQPIEEEHFYSILKKELNIQNKEIQMILRVGYSKHNTKSKRRPVAL